MKEPSIVSENKTTFDPFAGPAIQRIGYTTQPQAEIWIACKLGDIDANRAYNESVTLTLRGDLNKKALLDAIQTVVDRHEALRSVFSTDGRFMTIFKSIQIQINQLDISTLGEAEKNTAIKTYLNDDANYIFDLVKGPLFKVGLIKSSETEHHLILTAHHIICDGWSIGIMLEELGSLYSASVLNTQHNLPKPESYCAYADEQQIYLSSEEYRDNVKFWLDQYKGNVPQLTLPTDFPRPKIRTFKSERLDFQMDKSLLDALKKTGIKAGCSLVTTLLSSFELFLYAQTNQNDIVLGLPSADQAASGKTQMIGHCVNLLPLRSKIDPNTSFINYLKQRNTQLFDAYDHQKLSFGELLQKLNIARDPSRVPLVPVSFNIDMGMTSAVSFSGLDYELKSNPRAFETFEIFMNATGSSESLVLEWQYNSNLFKPETIREMMASWESIIANVVANPDIKISETIKTDDAAYVALNNTKVDYPQLPLHELISIASQNYKQKTAVKFGKDEISYEDFDQKANQLSHLLIEKGVAPDHIVGVALPRSSELVITLMAIMRCGAAYLPLDPTYPKSRLELMVEDSGAQLLITSKDFTGALGNSQTLYIEDLSQHLKQYPKHPIDIKVNNNQIAYILYTSGSTGKPKGVPITHKNLVNFLYSMIKEPGIKENDRLLSITTISFDIAGLELYIPLLSGATLIIANEEIAKDGRLLLEYVKDESITMLQATPTTWQMLFDTGWDNRLPIKALCGGEQLPMSLAKKLLAKVDELWNMYGPTETTVWSTTKQILMDDELLTIGKPIANTQVYILNEQGRLMPPGQVGEIVIGGDGVAQGYWKRPELTNEKFLADTFNTSSGNKIYRTGDLGQLLKSGEIQCLGRVDDQVKIRGHRIELGEIEEAVGSIDGIASAVVLVHNDQLKAFATISNATAFKNSESTWKSYLKERLPMHMVPNEIIPINEFPTTLNGKIDRKTLANSLSAIGSKQEFNEARTASEQLIAAIWQDCLGIDKIDIQSDFFELGGHSLIAVKVMTQIEKQTGNRLPLASLLEHPTIEKLAAYLDKNIISWDSLVPLQPKGTKIPLFIIHGADHNVLLFKNLADNLDNDQPVYGLQAKGLSGDIEPLDTIEDMAAHYISEIKTVNPNGPYLLGGFSFGGIVAFEMVKQLKAEGKEAKIIALLDSYVYPHYFHSNPFKKKMTAKLYNICQLFYMGFDMFSSSKNFKRRKELLKLKFEGFGLRLKHGREKQFEMQFNRSPKIDDMLELAYRRYNLVPQDIQVDLFRSSEDIYFAHDYDTLGWKRAALGGVRKHLMPGNHSELLISPAVEECAKILQSLLDKENE